MSPLFSGGGVDLGATHDSPCWRLGVCYVVVPNVPRLMCCCLLDDIPVRQLVLVQRNYRE